MKVVINRCFGGFGVSVEALKELILLGAAGVEKTPAKEYYGGNNPKWETKWEADYREAMERAKDAGDGYRRDHWGSTLFKDGFVYGFDRQDKHRSDPILVAVVERLGDKASGQCAKLEVVEVPDDAQWHIHEYDGSEHVAEDHRTW